MHVKHIFLTCMMLLLLAGCGHNVVEPTDTQPPEETQNSTATQKPAVEVEDEVTVEAGLTELDPAIFVKGESSYTLVPVETLSVEQLSAVGTYPMVLECDGHFYNVTVRVVDTVAPVGTVQEVTSLDVIPEPSSFLTEIIDATAVTVSYKTEPVLVYGKQTVVLILTDGGGNTTELISTLMLDLDMEAPQIHGVKDILVDQGETVAYREGITVSDDRDPSPKLAVDSSQVDLSTPGTYTVIYSAVDAAGNTGTASAVVTVREMKKNYASLETIYEMVDELLEEILDEDMTTREQLKAIERWFWNNCTYTSRSDKSDLHQAAYVMMTRHKGDCYNYHGLTRLMLERLGIPNIDVHKVKNYSDDSDHFWSMVSLDGGQTWYHYDCSPRYDPYTGKQVHVFLFTDAQLDAFSAKYRNCYNRDKGLYPATPEEPID